MGKTTKLIVRQQIAIEEHRFVTGGNPPAGGAGASPRHPTEHLFITGGNAPAGDAGVSQRRPTEHLFITGGNAPAGEASASQRRPTEHLFVTNAHAPRVNASTVVIKDPHVVRSVTIEKRPDGTLFLTLDE